MAVGPTHIEWLSSLAKRAAFNVNASVLDLGPQDIQIDRESLSRVASRHLGSEGVEVAMEKIFKSPDMARPDAQKAFYGIFGATSYRSVDLCDPRATYVADLNRPIPGIGTYDVVTNFGTTEHVFNIGETFASIHRLLKTNGVALHCVPAFAFINHGYFNVHPNVYVDVARANAYEIVDLLYVDNIFVRDKSRGMLSSRPIDFESFQLRPSDMDDTSTFMTRIASQFYRNLTSAETRRVLAELLPVEQRTDLVEFPDPRLHLCFVFDLCFVALRRTASSPRVFVPPSQQVFSALQQPGLPSRVLSRLRAYVRSSLARHTNR